MIEFLAECLENILIRFWFGGGGFMVYGRASADDIEQLKALEVNWGTCYE